MIQDDTMYVEAAITSLFDVPLSELAVRIAVLESEIEDPSGSSRIFRNVVKSIIPEAAGQILYRSWLSGEKLYVRGKWLLEKVYNPDNLRAVAFIQNESSREVLQASLDKRGTVTGSNKAEVDQEGPIISIYPNPAKEIAYIDFNGALNRSIQVELINNLGQIVISSKAPEGTTIFEIPARGYSPGLYMLRLSNENGIIRNIKIIIAD
jgi:hypothetical protein